MVIIVSRLNNANVLEIPFEIHIQAALPFICAAGTKAAVCFRIVKVPCILAQDVVDPDPERPHGNQTADIIKLRVLETVYILVHVAVIVVAVEAIDLPAYGTEVIGYVGDIDIRPGGHQAFGLMAIIARISGPLLS